MIDRERCIDCSSAQAGNCVQRVMKRVILGKGFRAEGCDTGPVLSWQERNINDAALNVTYVDHVLCPKDRIKAPTSEIEPWDAQNFSIVTIHNGVVEQVEFPLGGGTFHRDKTQTTSG